MELEGGGDKVKTVTAKTATHWNKVKKATTNLKRQQVTLASL